MTTRTEPAVLLAAPAGLIVARVVGLDVVAVWCAFAVCVLLPGWGALRLLRVERELGLAGSAPAAAALGLAVWTPPLAAAFIVHLSLGVPLVVVLGAGAVLCGLALVRPPLLERAPWWEVAAGTLAAGAFAFLAWRLSTGVISDALFHVGRMRKIEDIASLSITSISSYQDGPPHAGYAFPLLHAAFAGVARVAGVDVATAFIYLQPLCAFLAMLGAYAFARSLTGWRTAGYLAAVVLAWDLCTLINGLVMQINQPPVFAFFVLAPGALMLFVAALRGSRSAAWGSMAAVGVIALVHPTYAVPCLAIAAGMAAGSWRAHLRMPPIALEALAASVVRQRPGGGLDLVGRDPRRRRRAVITHSDEFVHRWRACLPDVPLGSRVRPRLRAGGGGALVLLVRYRRTLPAAGAMLGLLALLLVPGREHGRDGRRRNGAVPPLLAAAALAGGAGGGGLRRRAAARPVVDRGRRRPGGAAARAPRRAGFLARAGQLGCRRRHRGDRRRADPRAAPRHRPRPVVGGVAADCGDAGRADPAQRRHRAGRGAGGAAPAAARRPVGRADAGSRGLVPSPHQPLPVVMGEEHRLFELVGEAPVYAVACRARTRAEPKIDTAGRRQDSERFFDPATSQQERLDLLSRWDVTHVLVDLEDQSDVADAITALPGGRGLPRRPVICAPALHRRAPCPVSATGATTT